MSGLKSEIIVFIDVSSFYIGRVPVSDLIAHVKEAVSFQISRGAITNRKLIKLGLEPSLSRVKWTYKFFDSSNSGENKEKTSRAVKDRTHLQTLTYDCWDQFEKQLNDEVRAYSISSSEGKASEPTRMRNIVGVMQQLNICILPEYDNAESMIEHLDLAGPIQSHSLGAGKLTKGATKYLYVFTHIPKDFSCLIHLARGITKCRLCLSDAVNCSMDEVQVCLVDLHVDALSISLREYNGLQQLPCFWDEFYEKGTMLKVLCLRRIMMIHKLLEMRYPWKYECSLRLPFGYGLGMKRLRQWEWRIPHELPKSNKNEEPTTRCSSFLRKCYSEDMYCVETI